MLQDLRMCHDWPIIRLKGNLKHVSGNLLKAISKGLGFKMRTTTRTMKVKNDHRSKFSNLSNWKEEA